MLFAEYAKGIFRGSYRKHPLPKQKILITGAEYLNHGVRDRGDLIFILAQVLKVLRSSVSADHTGSYKSHILCCISCHYLQWAAGEDWS